MISSEPFEAVEQRGGHRASQKNSTSVPRALSVHSLSGLLGALAMARRCTSAMGRAWSAAGGAIRASAGHPRPSRVSFAGWAISSSWGIWPRATTRRGGWNKAELTRSVEAGADLASVRGRLEQREKDKAGLEAELARVALAEREIRHIRMSREAMRA